MGQQPDYAKLARQHGGKVAEPVPAAPSVDYASLAAEVAGQPGADEPLGAVEQAASKAEHLKGPMSLTDRALNLLPSAAGMAGGIAGARFGPAGRVAVGGALGAVGEAVRGAVNTARGVPWAPESVSDYAVDIAKQGAIQGGLEAAGVPLAAGANKAGRYLMNRALNPPDRLAREFPDVSQTLIDRALTVSKGGFQRARQMLRSAKAQANAALTEGDAKGITVPVTAATDALKTTLKAVMESADIEGGLRALSAVERKLLTGRGGDLTLTAADALKRSLQAEARNLYRAASSGQGRRALNIKAQAAADMASALNDAIEKAAQAAGIKGYQAANFAAKELIGATRSLAHAVRPGKTLYQAMVRPGVGAILGGTAGQQEGHPVLGALAGAAMTSPLGMSLASLALSNRGFQAALRQMPRGVTAALMQFISEQQSEPPQGSEPEQ